MKKIIISCEYISIALFCMFVIIFAFTWISDFNPRTNLSKEPWIHWYYISLGDIHITVAKKWGVKLGFFNQDMPYTGSLLALAQGEKEITISHYDGWGIYFRSIKHPVRTDWNQWTLMVSLWYPVIVLGILPIVFVCLQQRLTTVKPDTPTIEEAVS